MYRKKNIDVKNAKEYIKKVNLYKKTLTKEQINETKKIHKNNKYIEMCIKIYKNMYIQT